MEEARAIVSDHLCDPEATFLNSERDDGHYEFDVLSNGSEYDYEIDAITGAVLKAELDDDFRPVASSVLSVDEAKALVLAHLGDEEAIFLECELDDDDSIYEFEVRSNGVAYDCEIDAVTGAVLKAEIDD